MNIAVAATTFTLVIPAELPDKTFISCVVLSSRHRPLPVWVGACSTLVMQAGIAVAAGGLLALLPKAAVRAVVAALFLGGAVYLLASTERAEQERAEKLASGEEQSLAGGRSGFWRITAITFGVVRRWRSSATSPRFSLPTSEPTTGTSPARVRGGGRRVHAGVGRRRAGRPHDHTLGAACNRPAPLGPGPARPRHLLGRVACDGMRRTCA